MKKNVLVILLFSVIIATSSLITSCGGKCQLSSSDSAHIAQAYYQRNPLPKSKVKPHKNLFENSDTSSFHGKTVGLAAAYYAIDPQGTRIDTTQANKQIASYLKAHNNAVKSYYLNSTVLDEYSSAGAVYIKVMLAHSKRYLSSGGTEEYSLIIAGIDEDGNYVMLDDGNGGADIKYVFNNVAPCPYTCGEGFMTNDIIKNK